MKNLSQEKIDQLVDNIKDVIKSWGNTRINILTILFAVFATLKLTGYITWSWWWVTAPLWGGLAFLILFLVLIILLLLMAYLLK